MPLNFSQPFPPQYAAIATGINIINLDNNKLGTYSRIKLAEAFSHIPKRFKILTLNENNLDELSSNQTIAHPFTSIPSHIEELYLADNNLANYTIIQLKELLFSIPDTVTTLSLQGSILGAEFTPDDLATALSHLHKKITTLYLGANNLGDAHKKDGIITILQALPPQITALYLDENELHEFSAVELIQILDNLPENLSTLSLADNNLAVFRENLASILAAIPKTVIHLDLSHNSFRDFKRHSIPTDELAKAFAAIPANVTSLSLSRCALGNRKESIVKIIRAIPSHLTTCDLSYNNLAHCIPGELKKVFTALHGKDIKTLDLSGNGLSSYSDSVLNRILMDIPEGVQILNLSQNDLEDRTDDEWVELLNCLPKSITKVIVDDPVSQKQINQIFDNKRAQQLIVTKKLEEASKPPLPTLLVDLILGLSDSFWKTAPAAEEEPVEQVSESLNL